MEQTQEHIEAMARICAGMTLNEMQNAPFDYKSLLEIVQRREVRNAYVPDGYALVPIEPTSKMLMAADRVIWADADILGNYCNLWYAMLDASQQTTKEQQK